MIHIVNKVYLDYQFSPLNKTTDIVNIYVDGFGKYEFVDNTNIHRYDSFDDIITRHGSVVKFIRYLLSFQDKKVIIRLLEDDMLIFYAYYLKAIYDDKISIDMFGRLIKLTIINHKYVHSQISNYDNECRANLRKLEIPNKDKIKELFDIRQNIDIFTESEKTHISFEYLLANAIVTEYEESNIYNIEFCDRLSTVLFKSVYWDFVGIRRDMLYGLYRMSEFYDTDIDLESENVDEQIAACDMVIFDTDSSAKDVDFIKRNFKMIIELTKKHQKLIDEYTFDIGLFMEDFMTDNTISLSEIQKVIEQDKKYPSSQIFGRTEFRFNMNNILIGMLYSGNIDLTELKL